MRDMHTSLPIHLATLNNFQISCLPFIDNCILQFYAEINYLIIRVACMQKGLLLSTVADMQECLGQVSYFLLTITNYLFGVFQ